MHGYGHHGHHGRHGRHGRQHGIQTHHATAIPVPTPSYGYTGSSCTPPPQQQPGPGIVIPPPQQQPIYPGPSIPPPQQQPIYPGPSIPPPQQQQPITTTANVAPRNEGRRKSDVVVLQLSSTLEQADKSELQELHDSEEKLHALLDTNDEVQQLQVERELLLAGNRSVAENNMKQAPRLKESKERLGELYKQLNEQNEKFDENKRNLESLSGQYNPETIMALLQTSVAQSEESSEKTADSFMDGNLSVDEFLEKYLKERTTVHMRRTKVDKMKELLRLR